MQKKDSVNRTILEKKDYLRFSTSIGYKAGLLRNDKDLLSLIDARSKEALRDKIEFYLEKMLDSKKVNTALLDFSENVKNEILEKETEEHKNKVLDDGLSCNGSENTHENEEGEYNDIVRLVTLNSDIIRNTTGIDLEEKATFIKNNVNAYICLMWGTLELFQDLVSIPE